MDSLCFAKVVNSCKIHASKLHVLMMNHWKLRVQTMVVKHFHNSFLLQFQFEEDQIFTLNHEQWLLQGYFIVLCPCDSKPPMLNVSSHAFLSLWVQLYGLPKHYYSEDMIQVDFELSKWTSKKNWAIMRLKHITTNISERRISFLPSVRISTFHLLLLYQYKKGKDYFFNKSVGSSYF